MKICLLTKGYKMKPVKWSITNIDDFIWVMGDYLSLYQEDNYFYLTISRLNTKPSRL